jgi:ribosomal protein S6E (S10)
MTLRPHEDLAIRLAAKIPLSVASVQGNPEEIALWIRLGEDIRRRVRPRRDGAIRDDQDFRSSSGITVDSVRGKAGSDLPDGTGIAYVLPVTGGATYNHLPSDDQVDGQTRAQILVWAPPSTGRATVPLPARFAITHLPSGETPNLSMTGAAATPERPFHPS